MPMFFYLILYKVFVLSVNRRLLLFANKKTINMLLLFISLIIISNIMWFFNPYKPNEQILINIIVLYIYNLLAIIVFTLYWRNIDLKIFGYFFLISGFVLFLSLIAQFVGFEDLPFGGDIRHGMEEKLSLFGVRYGGYAEDQNYATFGMIIWYFTVSIFFKNRIFKYLVLLFAIFGIFLSFSKTIIISGLFIYSLFLAKRLHVLKIYLFFMFFLLFITGYLLFEIMETLSTMSTRFLMWKVAFEDFLNSPIIGHGISSVRSNFQHQGYWYVQPHNSFVAMLHDFGIIVLFLYILFFKKLKNFIEDERYLYILGIFFFLSFTQELFVFQYPYFILAIFPIILLKKQNRYYITRIKI